MIAGTIPVGGRAVRIPGVTIINTADNPRCRLSPEDYRARTVRRPNMIVYHTTGGKDPQRVLPGAGKRGHALDIFDLWDGADHGGGERQHSAALMVIDFDGSLWVAGDLMTMAAYHAKGVNDRSVGVEMCTTADGSIYEATLSTAVALGKALTEPTDLEDGLGIPFQVHRAPYRNGPLVRLERVNGDASTQSDGRDVYGIIGHRDQTGQRGRGDPGDAIYERMVAAGAEPLDFSVGEDLISGRRRQQALVARGEPLAMDGLVGPASLAAARRQGFARWRDVPSG